MQQLFQTLTSGLRILVMRHRQDACEQDVIGQPARSQVGGRHHRLPMVNTACWQGRQLRLPLCVDPQQWVSG
jgi:hypothetical protein